MLKVKTILVSQPTPASIEKSPYHEIFTKHNVGIEYCPFIKVEGVSLKEYRAQRREIMDHTAIIFTSRTTVDHFFRICDESRITVPETMKYLCNTEVVALYLQKYIVYRKRRIFFADGGFSNFMELILKNKKEKMMLVLSEPYRPELATTMEKLKINFSKAILSRTMSTDLSNIKISDYDMLVLFTPTEIVSLTKQFGTENLPLIATFGDGATRAAVDAGLTVSLTAPTPEAPSMAKAVDIFIAKINAGEKVAPVELCYSKESEEFLKTQQAKVHKKTRVRKPSVNGAKSNGAVNGSSRTKLVAPASTRKTIVKPEPAIATAKR